MSAPVESASANDIADSQIWAITAYFNPSRYRSRLRNYRIFRQHLNVPLVTVELGFDGTFELNSRDAEVVIQIDGHDVLWQKERLLNVAISAVPEECAKIARLDCDVVLQSPQWPVDTCRLLDEFPFVQVFSEAHDQPQGSVPGTDNFPSLQHSWPSFADCWHKQREPELLMRRPTTVRNRSKSAMGLGWAFRRELHENLDVYDKCILGGGEHAILCAACECPEIVTKYQCMNSSQQQDYLNWAELFRQRVGGRLASVPGKAFHLYHGDIRKRGYGTRYVDFRQYDFRPDVDIAVHENGSWRWSTDKPVMHHYVRDYFDSRCEDD